MFDHQPPSLDNILQGVTRDAALRVTTNPVPLTLDVSSSSDWVQRYKELKAAESTIKGLLEEARDNILDCVRRGGAEEVSDLSLCVSGEPKLRVRRVEQSRIDVTRLRSEMPDLAQAYTKKTQSVRVEIV